MIEKLSQAWAESTADAKYDDLIDILKDYYINGVTGLNKLTIKEIKDEYKEANETYT